MQNVVSSSLSQVSGEPVVSIDGDDNDAVIFVSAAIADDIDLDYMQPDVTRDIVNASAFTCIVTFDDASECSRAVQVIERDHDADTLDVTLVENNITTWMTTPVHIVVTCEGIKLVSSVIERVIKMRVCQHDVGMYIVTLTFALDTNSGRTIL